MVWFGLIPLYKGYIILCELFNVEAILVENLLWENLTLS